MNRAETNRVVRIGASAFVCVALAVGTSGVAFADGSHSNGHSDHGSSNGPKADVDAVVTAIGTGGSFTAQFGTATPIVYNTLTGTTTYFEGHTAVTAAALAVGEQVDLQLATPATTPPTVLKVTIDVASYRGKVTALGVSSFTITGPEGTTRTVNVTSSTTYTSGGTASTFGAIVVGSGVEAQGLLGSTAGTITALSVKIEAPHVVAPHASGKITVIGNPANSFTLQKGSSTPVVYATTSNTTYFEGATAVNASALAIGQEVDVLLATPATTPPTALKVTIDLSSFEGTVTAIPTAGNALTITGPQGTTRTVNVTSSTTYTSGGTASTFGAIAVGSKIEARGVLGATPGTLTASTVKILAATSEGHHGHFENNSGQHGHSQHGKR